MGVVDAIVDSLPEVSVQGLNFAFIIITIIVLGAFGYWAMGRFKGKIDYEGRRVDAFRITVQGRYTIEVNLAHNDSFDEEMLERFEDQADTKIIKGILEKIKQRKEIWIYNAKITDDTEADEDFADKVRIISPVQLESEDNSWLDQSAKRPFFKPWAPERRRNIVFVDTTRKIRTYDEDKHPEDWFFASVLPRSEPKVYNTMRDNPFPNAPVNIFRIIKNEAWSGLAELVSMTKTLRIALENNKVLADERDMFHKLYKNLLGKVEGLSIEKNESDEELAQKPYIEALTDALQKQEQVGGIWVILSGVIAGIFAIIMPSIFPSMDTELAQIVGMGIGLGIGGFGYMYWASKQVPVKKVSTKEIS